MACTHSCDISPRWGYKGLAPIGLGVCASIKLISALKGRNIKTKGAALRKTDIHIQRSPEGTVLLVFLGVNLQPTCRTKDK